MLNTQIRVDEVLKLSDMILSRLGNSKDVSRTLRRPVSLSDLSRIVPVPSDHQTGEGNHESTARPLHSKYRSRAWFTLRGAFLACCEALLRNITVVLLWVQSLGAMFLHRP